MFRMTKSQEIGDSDAYYEFTCTPCAGEGLNAEGKSYCGICNKDFCDVCIQYHKRFFDKHTVVESTQKDCRICDEETASYSVDNEIIEKVNDEEELTDRPWLQEVNTLQRAERQAVSKGNSTYGLSEHSRSQQDPITETTEYTFSSASQPRRTDFSFNDAFAEAGENKSVEKSLLKSNSLRSTRNENFTASVFNWSVPVHSFRFAENNNSEECVNWGKRCFIKGANCMLGLVLIGVFCYLFLYIIGLV